MSVELLKEINNRYLEAVAFHRESADLMWFVYLPGYALLHEYQNLAENLMQRRVKRYIINTYYINVPELLPTSDSSVSALTKGINRKKMDYPAIVNIVQKSWNKYCDWELETLNIYQGIATSLIDSGEVSAFNFVGNIIKDVKTELDYINDKIVELTAHDWAMDQIVAEQTDILERYEYLIRKLLGKSKKYHHNNGNYSPDDRMTVLEKYEE